MSTNLDLSRQFTMASVASVCVNGLVHPICTAKNIVMVDEGKSPNRGIWQILRSQLTQGENGQQGFLLRGAYRGMVTICLLDAAIFAPALMVNSALESRNMNPFLSASLAGMSVSPIAAFGEGWMVNRQVNAQQRITIPQIVQRSMRINGLILTMGREIPYSGAVFALTPFLAERMGAIQDESTRTTTAAAISGFAAGGATTPMDRIKTIVQTQTESTSIVRSVQKIVSEEGITALFKGAPFRAGYVAGAVAITRFIYDHFPNFE